jgi:hypothetical protein
MLDRYILFAKVHQYNPMMNTNVVVGNTLTADNMITSMNKNIAAYLPYEHLANNGNG